MNNQDKAPQGITPNLSLWSYQLQRDSKVAIKTRKDLEIHLITRAFKDEEFRRELLANPKTVVEKELIGTKLPEDIKIQVLEETETTLYMVLPSNPYEGLTELELKNSLGMTYEDVAEWVLEQQRNHLLDETSSVALITRAWQDEAFKQQLLSNPMEMISKLLTEKIQIELDGVTFVGLEETANTVYIVLPYNKGERIPLEITLTSELEVNQPIMIAAGSCSSCQFEGFELNTSLCRSF